MTASAPTHYARLCSLKYILPVASIVLGGLSQETLAQVPDKSGLTAEFLIGDAVSLTNKTYDEIEKAIQRFNNNDTEGTIEYLKRAKEKYPKLPPTDVTLAKMQLTRRNARAVRVLLERAIVNYPDDPEAYILLANQAFGNRLTAESHALFVMAQPKVEAFAGNAKRKRHLKLRVLAGLSAVAQRRGQWDDSYQVLKQWIEAEEDNPMPHARLGVTLFRLDKPQEALAEFTAARKIDKKMPHPYVSLGQLFEQDGEVEKARKAFEHAYKDDGSDANIAQAYAEWLLQHRDLDTAKQVAESLRKQSPESETALLLDGIVAYLQGDAEHAEQTLQKILRLDPRHARATDLLALLLISSDKSADQERALSYATLNAERFPENAQATITKAWVLYKMGRADQWKDALRKAQNLQLLPDSSYLIAQMFVGEGRKKDAKKLLENTISQKSRFILFRQNAEDLLKQLEREGV